MSLKAQNDSFMADVKIDKRHNRLSFCAILRLPRCLSATAIPAYESNSGSYIRTGLELAKCEIPEVQI